MTLERVRAQQRASSQRYRDRNPEKCRDASRTYMRRRRIAEPEIVAAHYEASKVKIESRNRALISEAKSVPCADCGVQYPPIAMDFDHRDGETKDGPIAHAVNRRWGQERLLAEIAKCDVRCAVCHRLRHAQETN